MFYGSSVCCHSVRKIFISSFVLNTWKYVFAHFRWIYESRKFQHLQPQDVAFGHPTLLAWNVYDEFGEERVTKQRSPLICGSCCSTQLKATQAWIGLANEAIGKTARRVLKFENVWQQWTRQQNAMVFFPSGCNMSSSVEQLNDGKKNHFWFSTVIWTFWW